MSFDRENIILVNGEVVDIPTDAQIRSQDIQTWVRKTEKIAPKILCNYLNYRTTGNSPKHKKNKRKASTKEKMADLEVAISYLRNELRCGSLRPFNTLFSHLLEQVELAKNACHITPQDAPLVTELIYRTVYHADIQCGADPNPANEKRGGELAACVSRNPNWKIVGGICLFLYSVALTLFVAALSLLSGGISAPVTIPLLVAGLCGIVGGGYLTNQGRKRKVNQYLFSQIGTAKAETESDVVGVPSLTSFFKPANRGSVRIAIQPGEESVQYPPDDRFVQGDIKTLKTTHRRRGCGL